MGRNRETSGAFESLRRASRRYRRGQEVGRFFTQLVARSTPGIIVLLSLVFLSKLLWPALIYAAWLVGVWVLLIALYLLRNPSQWRIGPWRVVGLTDRRSGNSGLFMAVSEAGGEDWLDDLSQDRGNVRPHFPAAPAAVAAAICAAPVSYTHLTLPTN